MKTSNDPNIETLAMLASQARFANLNPAAAIRSAFALWLECQAVLEKHGENPHPASMPAQTQKAIIQKPTQWPIPLHNFYSLVVKGRDEGASEKRLMKFLPEFLLATSIKLRGKSIREGQAAAKKQIAGWRDTGLEEPHWDWLVEPYLKWWQHTGRLEGKRQGGKTRATQRKK